MQASHSLIVVSQLHTLRGLNKVKLNTVPQMLGRKSSSTPTPCSQKPARLTKFLRSPLDIQWGQSVQSLLCEASAPKNFKGR